ncbi:hypothetical protein FIV00_00075 [Labrenzia sp. THAF82]|uniref:hypothetical protein n=1 Tax=Labrenzia sp. THAF82 TaxID=2587861 RepID=UPI001268A075|nr:hypothetical protein [Labrenzia sp. THAF82]QFT28870.1 hypothetical protein FIV00_00075 [Labrenzia sp. THAF82]
MSQGNHPRRGIDGPTIFCGGLSAMGTLVLAPRFMSLTADLIHGELVRSYGADMADFGLLVNAGATFVVTYFGLLLTLQLCLRLLIRKIGHATRRTRPHHWH